MVNYFMNSSSRAVLLLNVSRWTFVFSCVIALLYSPAKAQLQSVEPSSGLINPRAIVFSPATGKVYVVDTNHGAVNIYSDAAGQMHRVKVGAEPVSIAINLKSGRAYVANAGDGTVTVLDGKADTILAVIPVSGHPYSIAADPVTNKVYVTHTFGDDLSIIDGVNNTVKQMKTGSVDWIAINSKAGKVYLLGFGGSVKVLDEATYQLTQRPVVRHAWGLALDENTDTIYVAGIESAELNGLSSNTAEISTLRTGEIPCSIAVDSKNHRLYVANYGDNTVTVLDAKTQLAVATIHVGDHPKFIAVDLILNHVYVANANDNTVTVIDTINNTVQATLSAPKNPYALAVVPAVIDSMLRMKPTTLLPQLST